MEVETFKEVHVKLVSILLAIILMLSASSLCAQDIPDSSTMFFDLVILRPLGVAICALGISAAILSAPFNIANPKKEEVGKKLIEEPFKFTFYRPLGEIESGGLKR